MQSKEQMREKEAAKAQEAMPEAAKAARTDMQGKVLVSFGNKQQALVHVTHEGQPHPKGWNAVIVSHSGDRIDGAQRQQIIDSAVDYCKGKKPVLSVEDYKEPVGSMKTAEVGTPGNGGQPVDASYPASGAGPDSTPVGATSDSPQGGSGQKSANPEEVPPAAPTN